MSSAARIASISVSVIVFLTGTLVGQDSATILEVRKPIERQIKGKEAHYYAISLIDKQFLHVNTLQDGVDVVVSVFSPRGAKLDEVDSLDGSEGLEPIWFESEGPGDYRIEVKTLQDSAAGRYTIEIVEQRPSRPRDADYVAAQKVFQKAYRLRAEGSEESLNAALLSFAEARRLFNSAAASVELAQTLVGMGRVLSDRGDLDSAMGHFRESLRIAEDAGLKQEKVTALKKIADTFTQQGNYIEAIRHYQASIRIIEASGDNTRLADSKHNLANVYYNLGDFETAIPAFREVLQIGEQQGSKKVMAAALNNLADIFWMQGDTARGLEYDFRQLALAESMGDKRLMARSLLNIGAHHPTRSLEYWEKALVLAKELGDRRLTAMLLANIGEAHSWAGEYDKAIAFVKQSLALVESTGNTRELANDLLSIGSFHREKGDLSEAVAYLERARLISERLQDHQTRSGIAFELATIHLDRGEVDKARDLIESFGEGGRALSHKGWILLRLNDVVRSRKAFEESIAIYERNRARSSIGLFEQSRSISNLDPYYGLMEVALREGQSAEVLALAEQTKARMLMDRLRGGIGIKASALSATERSRERDLRNSIASISSQLANGTSNDRLLRELQEQLVRKQTDLDRFQAGLFTSVPGLSVQRGEMKSISLEEIGRLMPDTRSGILEFVVREDTAVLLVMTQESPNRLSLKAFPINAKASELEKKVGAFRSKVGEGSLDFQREARELYDLLIKPAEGLLEGKTTIIIVPDGPLWNLPFQALPDEKGRYWMEKAAIAYAPSLTALREMSKKGAARVRRPNLELLAFGNPIVSPETKKRVQRVFMSEKIEPLPEAGRLVKELGKLYGPGRSRVYTGSSANEEVAKQEAPKYRIVQFATHGILNDASPMYSHLVMAQDEKNPNEDGLLQAWELKDLDLKADMVILSACDTARGKISGGEGVIGMTWAAFIAGAPTTVASQWKVESSSTTEFMLEFHRQMLANKKISKAEALRRASLKLMKSAKYRHPSYWAPWILVGDGS